MTAVDDLGEFDPRSDEVMQCPYPHYSKLRAEGGVEEMPGEYVGRSGQRVFAVSRYDLVAEVIGDWRTYSSKFGTPGALPPPHLAEQLREIASHGVSRAPTMLTADPPVHTRYRRLVSKAFTARRVAELGPTVREICEGLVDEFAVGEVDLIPSYCVPIPTKTVAAALGVPQERCSDFKRWADASVAAIGRQLDDQAWIDSAKGVVELQQFFAAELEERRQHPADDLLTDLLAVRLTPEDGIDGEPLSTAELISIVQQLQVAGSETTASLIADAVVLLHGRPDQWQRLVDEPESAVAIVEECLRLSSPNLGMFRIATSDTTLGGVDIPKGSTLWVMFGSANRDEVVFGDDAAIFRAGRSESHIAFGKGVHFCVGAPLARLEAVVALQVLARRFSEVRPVDPDSLQYAPSCILRGLTSLPVELVPRTEGRHGVMK